jgi:hypothetical protein
MTLDQEAAIYGMFRKSGESNLEFECRIEDACAKSPDLDPPKGIIYAVIMAAPLWIIAGVIFYFWAL